MASGDTLVVFHPDENEPVSSNFATRDTRNNHIVLDFDMTTNESAVFSSILPRNYAGGGVTVYIHYTTTVTTGDVDWDAQFEHMGDGENVDSDSFAAVQSVDTTTVPGTSGDVDIVNIAFTNGGQIDSIAIGDKFRLKITRDATNDSAAADMELHAVEVKET